MNKTLLISLLSTCINSYACTNAAHDSLPTNSEVTTSSGIYITTNVEGPFSVQYIENKHTYAPAGKTIALPFGNSNKKWIKFKEIKEIDDQFYFIRKKSKLNAAITT